MWRLPMSAEHILSLHGSCSERSSPSPVYYITVKLASVKKVTNDQHCRFTAARYMRFIGWWTSSSMPSSTRNTVRLNVSKVRPIWSRIRDSQPSGKRSSVRNV